MCIRDRLSTYFDKCVCLCGCRQLPKFYFLCEDSIWGVRKACAECFAQVSAVCSPAVRRAELSQLFINLIYDQSRWVCQLTFGFAYGYVSSTVSECGHVTRHWHAMYGAHHTSFAVASLATGPASDSV